MHVHHEATGALDVHEKAVGGLNEPLLLVEARLVGGGGVEEIEVWVKGHVDICTDRGEARDGDGHKRVW